MPKDSELLTQVELPKAVPPPTQTMEEPKSTGSLAAAMSTSVASQGQSSTTASNTPASTAGQAGTSTTSVAAPKGPNKFKAAGAALIGSQVMTKAAGERGVAREAKKTQMTSVAGNTSAGRDTGDDQSKTAQAIDSGGNTAGLLGDANSGFGDGYKAVNKANGKAEDALSDTVKNNMTGMAVTTGVTGTFAGIKDMALSLQTMFSPDKDFLDKVEAGLTGVKGGADTVKSGSGFTKEVAADGSSAKTNADGTGKWAGGVADAIGAIKSAFLSMKGIVKLVKERGESTKKEKAVEGVAVATNMLESAKSVLSTINGVRDALGGTADSGIAQAIPGLDIALAAINIIKEGYYLVVSYQEYKNMAAEREKQKKDNVGVDAQAEDIRLKEAKISNLKSVIDDDQKRSIQLALDIAKAGTSKGFFGGDSEKDKLTTEKTRIDARISSMTAQINVIEVEKNKVQNAHPEALEFALVGEIAEANKKRVVRNSILLVAEFANLAGSIANLTGAGAIAGAGLKTAAATVKVGLPAARLAKQAGRDRQARKEAKGESDMITSGFDPSKSTAAKQDYRMKQINTLLTQIQGLSVLEGAKFDQRAAQLEGYIQALGVEPAALYRANNKQQTQITMLYKALVQREF